MRAWILRVLVRTLRELEYVALYVRVNLYCLIVVEVIRPFVTVFRLLEVAVPMTSIHWHDEWCLTARHSHLLNHNHHGENDAWEGREDGPGTAHVSIYTQGSAI